MILSLIKRLLGKWKASSEKERLRVENLTDKEWLEELGNRSF